MRPTLLAIIVGAVAVIILLSVTVLPGLLFPPQTLDTKTYSLQVAGFYGRGDYAGELLESDTIITNVTKQGNETVLSQSIKFKGAVCQRTSGEGRVFLDGSRITEPDAYYRIYVNGVLAFSHPMELGNSAVLPTCLVLPEKDYVLMGQNTGVVRAELVVYVHDFIRGAGGYSILAYDHARLT